MSEVVADSYADQHDRRVHGGHERRQQLGRAVMGQLQHVRLQRLTGI
jgi:hypothetical protein